MKKVLIYFTSPTCRPCVTFGPLVERLAREKDIELEKVDISTDVGRALARAYVVRSTPAVVCRLETDVMGDVVGSSLGAISEGHLRMLMRKWGIE